MPALLMYVTLGSLCLWAGDALTPEQQRGKELFQGCDGCHNVLTDARKMAPSLRTLYGKVRLVNGKRTLDQNVSDLILEGYNGMPSYRNVFRPNEWTDLLAYLKTLRARPEIGAVLKPIRGRDEEVLAAGSKLYGERCQKCHDGPESQAPGLLKIYSREQFASGEPVRQATILARVRDNHGATTPDAAELTDAALFSLIAYLKAQ